MKKRILAMLLAAMLMVSLLPVSAFATDATSGTCGENVTWSFDEASGTLTISGEGWMYDLFAYEYHPWYSYRDKIKAVVIEDGITRIGNYTFKGLDELETVLIPNTVTEVGAGAFYDCSKIVELNIPASLVQLDANAFEYATVLNKLCSGRE